MAEVFDFGLQEHKIKMDGGFSNNGLFAVVGDTARRLEVQLLNSSNAIQDTTGINLRLNADVAGKLTFVDAVVKDATKGVYTVNLSNGMFLEPGNWGFQWQITKGTNKISSFPFAVKIGENISEGGAQATNFYLNVEELRLKTVELENGYQAMINSTTGKDVISAPEIIAARSGEIDLNARLTKNEQETTAQFQQTSTHVTYYRFGSIDDNDMIQKAINDISEGTTLVFEKNKIYTDVGYSITDKKKIKLNGNGCKFILSSKLFAFDLVGTIDGLEIFGFECEGSGLFADNHKFICNFSGQFIKNVKYYKNKLYNMTNGISMNADLSGSYENAEVYDNDIENIVGIDPGQGYGILLAGVVKSRIHDNTIKRAQRHSIYHAKGEDNKIYLNTIVEHRKDVFDGSYRVAIAIFRKSVNVDVFENTLIDCYDGGITAYSDDTIDGGKNINVYRNHFIHPKNVNSAIFIDGLGSVKNSNVEEISIYDNYVLKDGKSGGSLVTLGRGKNIVFKDNTLAIENVNGERMHCITLGSVLNDKDFFDDIHIEKNNFVVSGPNVANVRAYMVIGKVCTSNIKVKITNSNFVNLFKTNGLNYMKIDYLEAVTNKNLEMLDKNRILHTSSKPTAGYFEKGDKAYNDSPSKGSITGWLCTASGSPGIWEEYGQIGLLVTGNTKTPQYVGQLSYDGITKEVYIALGTTSTIDWKLIS